jgi:NAD(P)-dependent dehydrogenase (short-subunit alcohol dehydrogenase family)
MGKLDKKVALVTGSAHSIGKAISIGLAREGADMVIADMEVEGLNKTAEEISALGVQVLPVETNVLHAEQIEALFTKVMEKYGRVDILVNCAGIFNGGPVDELEVETWDAVIGTNLRAPFLCTRQAFPIMKKQGGGRIINIGSISAQRPRMFSTPYSTAKSGLVGLTNAVALEGREHGINCGILHPGETTRDRLPTPPAGFTPPPGATPPAGFTPPGPMETMSAEEIAAAAVYMATCPPNVNVLELIQLPIQQPYLGRG